MKLTDNEVNEISRQTPWSMRTIKEIADLIPERPSAVPETALTAAQMEAGNERLVWEAVTNICDPHTIRLISEYVLSRRPSAPPAQAAPQSPTMTDEARIPAPVTAQDGDVAEYQPSICELIEAYYHEPCKHSVSLHENMKKVRSLILAAVRQYDLAHPPVGWVTLEQVEKALSEPTKEEYANLVQDTPAMNMHILVPRILSLVRVRLAPKPAVDPAIEAALNAFSQVLIDPSITSHENALRAMSEAVKAVDEIRKGEAHK